MRSALSLGGNWFWKVKSPHFQVRGKNYCIIKALFPNSQKQKKLLEEGLPLPFHQRGGLLGHQGGMSLPQ